MSCLHKKPRTESIQIDDDDDDDDDMLPPPLPPPLPPEQNGDPDSLKDQEEALVALIEHRVHAVEHNRRKMQYYQSKLDEEDKKLNESQTKLARIRSQNKAVSNKAASSIRMESVKEERRSMSPVPRSQPHSKTEFLIPAVTPKVSQPPKLAGSSGKAHVSSSSHTGPSVSSQSISASRERGDRSYRSSSNQDVEVQDKGTKRKFDEKEHKELVPMVCTSSKASTIQCHSSNHISSRHKRKLRCLYMCPVNDQLFATSALDGLVNLWEVQGRGSGASLLSTTDCQSPKHRRWPEDIAWHPHGNGLFSVYTADGGESQVSVLDLNRTQGKPRFTFLEAKPHVKGIINSIVFPPWENTCFVTGGSDHAVVLWVETDVETVWKPKQLHRSIHSSAVMGVAGMWQKQIILSVGADKRIVGYDANMERTEFKHQIDSKCMSVLPNPCDFNLFMVQAGTHEKQLRLYDIRLRQTEIHAFGWKQESSDSQSALINQAWSPDGLYISSGTADPMIHIFDIRYNAQKPSQSIKAHQKRVFKAVWLRTSPLLISISSDLMIGLHKIS